MKSKIITVFFILIVNIGFGQNSDIFSKKRISLGVSFSPDYSYRILRLTSGAEQWIVDYRDSTEIPKFGFTTGLLLIYEPWNRVSFETGLYYSNKGEKTLIYELNPGQHEDPSMATNQVRNIYSYNYLDIPIKVNYFILKGKVKIFVSAGLSTNLYLYSRSKLVFEGSDVTYASLSWGDLSRINISLLIGAGADFRIYKKLNFRVEPIYRQSITPIIDAPIEQYQYSIGVNCGLYLKLDK